jgi:hypothetical protein
VLSVPLIFGIVSVLSEAPMNDVDVDTVFQRTRLYWPKTLEAKHQIITEELTASLILRIEQGWAVIHPELAQDTQQKTHQRCEDSDCKS